MVKMREVSRGTEGVTEGQPRDGDTFTPPCLHSYVGLNTVYTFENLFYDFGKTRGLLDSEGASYQAICGRAISPLLPLPSLLPSP